MCIIAIRMRLWLHTSRRWLLRASNIRFLFVTARCNQSLRTNTRLGYLVEPSKSLPHLFVRGPRASSEIVELEACVMCKQVFFGLCFALYAVSGIHAETIAAGKTIRS